MSDLAGDREALARADQWIAEWEERIADQITVVEWMIRQGSETSPDAGAARELLSMMQQALQEWRVHRRAILDDLARAQAGPR